MTALQRETLSDDVALRRDFWQPIVAAPAVGLTRPGWPSVAKRTMDIVVGAVLLIIFLPVMGAVALVIKVRNPGPVLFRQERLRRDGATFQMLKFRTMCVDAPDRLRTEPELFRSYVHNDFKLALGDDPRIVPGGRFLRRSSLDELPQLFHVLKGTMSLVGPRPIVADELDSYGRDAWAYLGVKPGITGRWQTAGRNQIRYPERARLDAEYVITWSMWQDVAILLKTIPTILRRRGAN